MTAKKKVCIAVIVFGACISVTAMFVVAQVKKTADEYDKKMTRSLAPHIIEGLGKIGRATAKTLDE